MINGIPGLPNGDIRGKRVKDEWLDIFDKLLDERMRREKELEKNIARDDKKMIEDSKKRLQVHIAGTSSTIQNLYIKIKDIIGQDAVPDFKVFLSDVNTTMEKTKKILKNSTIIPDIITAREEYHNNAKKLIDPYLPKN